jgi:hypothetical protein
VGNGFPGLAVVSVIALLVALGVGALAILQPWETDSVAPLLSVAPGLGVGVGDSVVVSRDRQLAVEPAQPAAGGAPRFVAADVAIDKGEPQPRLGIAAARVVASPRLGGPSQGSPQPSQPEPTPAPQPAPVPVAVPVAAPPPPVEPVAAPPTRGAGGGTPGPVVSGGGAEGGGTGEILQVCEGDSYTLPLSPVEGTEGSEVPPPVATHDLTVYFGSSSEGAGFYLVLFDGLPVEPGKSCAQVDLGPLLGESIEAGTELRIEAVTLSEALEPVVP